MSDAPDDSVETAAAFETLTGLPVPTTYTAMDRYRDFRLTFMSTPEGQRVLREILSWGHMFRPSFLAGGPIDPYRMAIHEGERNVALRLLTTVNTEPKANPPTQTNRRGKTNA